MVTATYLMSPSYPKYYLAGEDCVWRVRLAPHQSLLVRLLDLQLRGGGGGGGCRDRLGVGGGGAALCGEQGAELHWVQDTGLAQISFSIGRDHQEQSHLAPAITVLILYTDPLSATCQLESHDW